MTQLSRAFVIADSETLGKYDDAVILSAGFTLGFYDQPAPTVADLGALREGGLYLKFNVEEQIKQLGRKTTPSVVDWWMRQGAEAASVLHPSPADVSILEIHVRIQKWLEGHGLSWKQVDLWDRNTFDWRKIAHIYENHLNFAQVPWNYTKVYDVVQWFAAYGEDRYMNLRADDVAGLVYHNALDDAILDQIRLMQFFKKE